MEPITQQLLRIEILLDRGFERIILLLLSCAILVWVRTHPVAFIQILSLSPLGATAGVANLCLTALADIAFTIWQKLALTGWDSGRAWTSVLSIMLWSDLAISLMLVSAVLGPAMTAVTRVLSWIVAREMSRVLVMLMCSCRLVCISIARLPMQWPERTLRPVKSPSPKCH